MLQNCQLECCRLSKSEADIFHDLCCIPGRIRQEYLTLSCYPTWEDLCKYPNVLTLFLKNIYKKRQPTNVRCLRVFSSSVPSVSSVIHTGFYSQAHF